MKFGAHMSHIANRIIHRIIRMIGAVEEVLGASEDKRNMSYFMSKPKSGGILKEISLPLNTRISNRKSHSNLLIIIEGNIGVGKTTLAKKLSRSLNFELFIEPSLENPYLSKFYADPMKYALPLQLWILQQRYMTYLEAVKHILTTGIGVILDRSIFSDEVFANVCTKEGYISKKGYGQYQFWHQRALSHLPIPHVTVFLDADPECCHSRIHRRGRECEGGVPLDYLSKLNDEYLIFLKEMKKLGSCVLSYNWTKFQDEDKIVSDILSVDITQWSEQFIKMFMLKSFNVSELFHPSTLQALET